MSAFEKESDFAFIFVRTNGRGHVPRDALQAWEKQKKIYTIDGDQ